MKFYLTDYCDQYVGGNRFLSIGPDDREEGNILGMHWFNKLLINFIEDNYDVSTCIQACCFLISDRNNHMSDSASIGFGYDHLEFYVYPDIYLYTTTAYKSKIKEIIKDLDLDWVL